MLLFISINKEKFPCCYPRRKILTIKRNVRFENFKNFSVIIDAIKKKKRKEKELV